MFKRAMSIVLVLVLLPQFTGCTSVRAFNLTDVERPGSEEVYGVITVGGQRVDFDWPSTDVRNDTIYATVDQSPYAIALDEVQQLRLKAGFARLTIHDVRRSSVRQAEISGIQRDTFKTMAGIKTDSIYSCYNIVEEKRLRDGAAKLAYDQATPQRKVIPLG